MKDLRFKARAIRSPRGARTTEIDWADGHKGVLPHVILRGYCPCAGCQGHSGEIKFIAPSDAQMEIEDITPVGGYALAFKWFDGHESGIYSFQYLRSLCHCADCCTPDQAEDRSPLPRV